ncbi:MAG: hypothetical protein R3D65_18235 [Zhengella sp.]|uniref:hypothetical protein n=1 Tax=Zhengella sp. TaxID=2282762 RepID=UPI001DF0974B|nr:hypothetical protein [Notoacmeibacter sp.]MCC0028386.1 hypothetical protein [Brucellaceae bacterium]
MKTLLATFAATGLALSAAHACPMHSAEAHDTMTTASIASDITPMSTRTDSLEGAGDETSVLGDKAADPVVEEDKAD